MVTAVGHRGAAGLEPENTLKSFRRAIELGVDAVECDVHLSADGHLIVMHDATVDRTTNGTGSVAEMPLADIRRLDAGDGHPPPTLEEVLDLVRGRSGLYCELKADGTEAPTVEAVRQRDMADEVLFISFAWERLCRARDALPSARTGLLFVKEQFDEMSTAAEIVKAEMVGVHYRHVCLDLLARASKAGLAVNVWTPNTPAEISAMIALGAGSITSDRPDRLLERLSSTSA